MPTYEYQCSACSHALEAFQKMSDPALTDCPVCHKATLNKLVSAAGFQLKGTGWYATDFRNKSKPEGGSEQTSKGSDNNDSSNSSTTGETK